MLRGGEPRRRALLHAATHAVAAAATGVGVAAHTTTCRRDGARPPPPTLHLQGCAPLETVVTLLAGAGQSLVFKVFKPVSDVTPGEVHVALQNVLAGNATAQHMQ